MAVVCSEGELDTTRTDGLLSLSQVVVRERMEEKPSEAGQTQHFQSGLRCRGTKSSGPSPAGFAVADLDLAFSGCLVIKTKKKSTKVVEMVGQDGILRRYLTIKSTGR